MGCTTSTVAPYSSSVKKSSIFIDSKNLSSLHEGAVHCFFKNDHGDNDDAYVCVNMNGEICTVSDMFCDLTGYTKQELFVGGIGILLEPSYRAVHKRMLNHVMIQIQLGKLHMFLRDIRQISLITKSGLMQDVLVRLHYQDGCSCVTASFCNATIMPESKHDEHEQKEEIQKDVMLELSHNLQTPLQTSIFAVLFVYWCIIIFMCNNTVL
jgi:PAS domain S-box-containing protein